MISKKLAIWILTFENWQIEGILVFCIQNHITQGLFFRRLILEIRENQGLN